MSHETDFKAVMGLGSAKAGTEHWWGQRVTAVAMIPLTVIFVVILAGAIGGTFEEVRATFAHPFNAVISVLFIAVTFRHLQLGLQVVIEDYVHGKGARTAALLASTFFCALFGVTGVFAVLRIAFAG